MISLYLIDDNTNFLRSLGRFLHEISDFLVVGQATSAEEALNAIGALQPRVVLLDQHMPGLTGIETAPRLKSILPELCVIMLTFDANERLRQLAERVGVDGFLQKSKIDTELVGTILRCLGEQ